jgi:thiosulfate/3-mercaptopyruvate sulfurtransferase
VNKANLVSARQLNDLIGTDQVVVFDCRFDFADTEKRRRDWRSGHIPGARYAHLDHDLSSPIEPHTGRHPLPETAEFARFLAHAGWKPGRQVVAYDEGSNAVAARLWWLMGYYGQPAALLDGGFAAWKAAGLPLQEGEIEVEPEPVVELIPQPGMTIEAEEIQDDSSQITVLDARASERFTGKVENLDTKAGHIPGAINRPFGANLQLNGRFKDPGSLRREFEKALENVPPAQVAHSCGSGVTACHNLFAMQRAGLDGSRLYAGSWSEWIRDPQRPIATGP